MKTVVFFLLICCQFGCEGNKLESITSTYPNGKTQTQVYIDNKGQLQDKGYLYFSNGKIQSQINYKDNKRDGQLILYYPNGGVREKSTYKNDSLVGSVYFYSKEGILEAISRYGNGKNQYLKEISFHKNGKIKQIQTFFVEAGLINAQISYSIDGKVKKGRKYSKFVNLKQLGKNRFQINLEGEFENKLDSITVHSVDDPQNDSIPIRKICHSKHDNFVIYLNEVDYTKKYANLLIYAFGMENGYQIALPFILQLPKSGKVPQNNIQPIW